MPGTGVGHRRGRRRDLSDPSDLAGRGRDLADLSRRLGNGLRRANGLRRGLGGDLAGLGDPEDCLGQLLQHHHIDHGLDDGLGSGAFDDLSLRIRLPAMKAARILDTHQRPHRHGFQPAEVTGGHLDGHQGPDGDGPGAVGYGGAVEGEAATLAVHHHPDAPGFVELADPADQGNVAGGGKVDDPAPGGGHRRQPQWTILDRASSMMSVAPRSLSAGIRVLISDFGTTVSTANPLWPNSSDTVGDRSDGSRSITSFS